MIRKLLQSLGAHSPKRYVNGALWIAATKFLSIGISLASTFYIARTLGPQNFGELNYALSIVSLLGFFGAIASSTVICRDLVRNESNQTAILGSAWFLILLSNLLTIFCAFVFALFLPHDHITLFVVGILCLAQLCAPFQVGQYIFYAKAETKKLSLTQLGMHIGVSTAKIIAMMNGQGVLVLAAIMFFEQLLGAIFMLAIYYHHTKISPTRWFIDFSYVKKLALDSLPYVFITMSVAVSGRIDQIFLKHYIDTAAVGFYSVAVQFTEIWQVLPQILLTVLFPALVNAHYSQNNYGKRILALTVFIAVYSFSVSLTVMLLAPILIPLIYGAAFSASIPLLQIYTWSLFGTIAGYLVTNILVTENRRRIQIIVGVLPMVTNIGLNLLWIPLYGAAGAAWATVISYSLAPIVPFFFSSVRQKLSRTK